ncbi:MAG: CCA tRNA nucleotidyltransferase [Aggregatilineales bacterium]
MNYSPDDIKRLMHERLPPGVQKLIELVSAEAGRMGVAVYLVGGFVRDLLLGRPNVDVDFVVEGDATELVNALVAHQGGDSFFGASSFFGTAKWIFNDVSIDFARTRHETYARPGVLPTVDPAHVSIADDLKRRDFTINALAIRVPDGTLLDRLSGIDDLLQTRSIRVQHDRSFIDDPTRIFRAVRFEQRFDFRIEPYTESLIAPALPIINDLSGERIRHEFYMIFQESEPEKAMMRLEDLGVLRQIDPELYFNVETSKTFREVRQHSPELEGLVYRQLVNPFIYWPIWTCYIDPIVWERLRVRLPFSNDMTVIIEQTLRAVKFVRSNTKPLKTSEFAKHIEPFDRIHAQVAAWAVLNKPDTQIRDYIAQQMDKIYPELTGNDLIAMGLQPGPAFGTILRKLRDAQLDGEISTVEEERALVHQWLEQGLFRE